MKLEKLLGSKDPLEFLNFEPNVIVLASGDIIISNLAIIDDNNYCLMSPFRLFESEESEGNVTMVAIKMVPGSFDSFFHIDARQVVTCGSMTVEMHDFYEKNLDAYVEKEAASVKSTSGNIVEFKPKSVH